MPLRFHADKRPQITFTSDFHELVQGDLVPGPCLLRYDPLRIIHAEAAACHQHDVRAHVRFHPGGTEWQGSMTLPAGAPLADLADPTGQGLMLTATFSIPAGCNELELWFSCQHCDGQTTWDSDFGKNHRLRFGLWDLRDVRADVTDTKTSSPQDIFEVKLTARPEVESIVVRWRLTAVPSFPRQSTALVAGGATVDGKTWSAPGEG